LTAIDLGGHHCAESAHVEVVLAHPSRRFVFDFRLNFLGGRFTNGLVCVFVLQVMNRTFGEVDFVVGCLIYEIADLAFEADVGDKTLAGFYVNAW
jgi:hypothetical protein